MNRLIDNLKGKLRFCFNGRGLFENNRMRILIIVFVATLALSQVACSQPADSNSVWDKPFGSPQYLLHATGHGTMDGPRTDDWWFLNPNQPKNGFIALPDGEGGTFTYSIDQFMGPFNTPREVCAAAGGKTKDNSIGGFSCKDMVTQPESPNSSSNAAQYCPAECKLRNAIWNGKDEYPRCNCVCEKGYDFDSNGLNCVPITSESGTGSGSSAQIQVVTPEGTTSVKPGDKTQVTLSSGGQAEIRAKCKNIEATLDLFKLVYDNHVWKMPAGLLYLSMILNGVYIDLNCKKLLSLEKNLDLEKVAGSSGVPTSSSNGAVEMELDLQQGPLRAEVVNDQVSLNVNTPTTTVSSEGLNDFGVAYDPNSGKSFVAAYQNPLLVKPSNGNQVPFTLGSGQQVEVSSSGIGPITTIGQTAGGSTYVSPNGKDMYGPVGGQQGGCHTDPSTGVVTCVDTIGDFSNPGGSNQGSPGQGGCYKDPITGTITCVDSNGNPIDTQSGSNTNQPGPGSSVPQSLNECETYTSEICGTWTLQGNHINAVWNNGAKATLNAEQFDNNGVVITRQDTVGSSAGLTARYEGRLIGNHVEGSVTWNWNGATWSGTWKADW